MFLTPLAQKVKWKAKARQVARAGLIAVGAFEGPPRLATAQGGHLCRHALAVGGDPGITLISMG